VHPFHIVTFLSAKHAQHVVLIHFPIALFIVGVLFDVLAHWRKDAVLAAAAYYNLLVAAISTIPVVITGVVAWQWALEAQRLKGILLMHLILGCISSAFICCCCFIHVRLSRNPSRTQPFFRLGLEALGVALIAVTAHLGGFLSGVNGPG
jgi:uncharacterized membrane protein